MFSLVIPRFSQSLATLLVALLSVFAIAGLQTPHLKKLIAQSQTISKEALQTALEAEKLGLQLTQKIPSFGFNNLIADWSFLQFAQYFGDETARQRTGYELSPEYFEVIVDRDPRFLNVYLPLSASISLYAGQPEKSIALMEKGLKSMSAYIPPKSYYVWRYKGIDELLFLGNAQAAAKSFEMAAQWASVHPDPASQNVAELSRGMAQFLSGNPDLKRIKAAQEATWTMVLRNAINANDERTVKQVVRRLEERGGKVTLQPDGSVSVKLP